MEWPEPVIDEPALETLMQWTDEGRCQATDGCWLEGDVVVCDHGYPSWAVVLGFIPDTTGD